MVRARIPRDFCRIFLIPTRREQELRFEQWFHTRLPRTVSQH